MEVQVKTLGEVNVVEVEGEIDGSSAPVLQDTVLSVMGPKCKLLLDMSDVAFMSSAGLRMLLLLYRKTASDHEGKLVLVGLSEELKDTMQATGFLSYFTTADSVDEGMTYFEAAS